VLSLLVQLQFESAGRFNLPAGCFFPVPDVESACINLRRRPEALLPVELVPRYRDVIHRAFSQRRKMMFKLLRADWPEPRLAGAFEAVRLSRQVRAEDVTLAQFVQLVTGLNPPTT